MLYSFSKVLIYGKMKIMQKGSILVYFLVVVLVLTGVASGAYYFGLRKDTIPLPFRKSPAVCIEDAKQCPDGSYVGRDNLKNY